MKNITIKFNNTENALNAVQMFNLRQNSLGAVISHKFRDARNYQRQLAKLAAEDFDTFKTLPNVSYKNVPFGIWLVSLFRNLDFKIFKLFTKTTPEEKAFYKKSREYFKTLTPEDIKKNTLEVDMKSVL